MAGTGRANRGGSLNEAIADAVVRSHTRCVGRGPRRALVELLVLDRSVDGGHHEDTTARRPRPDKIGFSRDRNSTALSWYR
jgi:hypothetical protein